jgi:hypothetical protein
MIGGLTEGASGQGLINNSPVLYLSYTDQLLLYSKGRQDLARSKDILGHRSLRLCQGQVSSPLARCSSRQLQRD